MKIVIIVALTLFILSSYTQKEIGNKVINAGTAIQNVGEEITAK
jgi:hypothetical protein